MSHNLTNQSKYLSKILRHDLDSLGLNPDDEGYVKISDLIKVSEPRYRLHEKTILSIVSDCPKQRFGIKEIKNTTYIRANQGHSQSVARLIKSDKLLTRLTYPIPGVFHGTYKSHLKSIQETGLNRMRREHIHIAKVFDAASGQRFDCNLIVFINMEQAIEDGIEFFESANGVILTEGIDGILPAKYLSFEERTKKTKSKK